MDDCFQCKHYSDDPDPSSGGLQLKICDKKRFSFLFDQDVREREEWKKCGQFENKWTEEERLMQKGW